MLSEIEQKILKTLVFFSRMELPLTAFQVYFWLQGEGDFVSVVSALDNSKLNQIVAKSGPFYGLSDNLDSWIANQTHRYSDAIVKYRRLSKFTRYLSLLPWVEGVAIGNSLAWQATTPPSDIDLLIIAKPGRIWSVRFLSIIPLIIFNLRPKAGAIHPICLSFFTTSDTLDFSSLKLANDPYLAYWCASLSPVFDRSNWHKTFEDSNSWVKGLLPQARFCKRASFFKESFPLHLPWLPIFESLVKAFQLMILPANLKNLANQSTDVIITDKMLKFHDQDARQKIATDLDFLFEYYSHKVI